MTMIRRDAGEHESQPPMAARPPSHYGEDLGPDGDHADEQGNRSQRSSFLHNSAKHRVLHEQRENIVQYLFFCQAPSKNSRKITRVTLPKEPQNRKKAGAADTGQGPSENEPEPWRPKDHPMTIASVQIIRKIVLGIAVLIGTLMFAFTNSSLEAGNSTHEMIEWFGIVAIVTCILGRTWASLYIGGRKIEQFVTNGPYSVMRNPLYFFSILGAAGAGAQLGSVIAGAVFGPAQRSRIT
ncbi:MAG: isoprenylcysteine carboxylmethyltransferase family protein [Rhizobiales bacterium]|nr:isoprenylcysteine carboxylmethyltransferase family protein [Hyphomicrobiales bacterium]